MDALILAAGRGERMRPLTDRLPKPLLEVGATTLIERQIERLVAAGHHRLVINLAYRGAQIRERLGDGRRYRARIDYSPEPAGALDTGGAIVEALARLRGEYFAVVNADIWTDFPYRQLPVDPDADAWLVLVDNPPHHPSGDFVLDGDRVRPAQAAGQSTLTFAGIGVYRRGLFAGRPPGRYPLQPILLEAAARDALRGVHYCGSWTDIGTPARLAALRACAAQP